MAFLDENGLAYFKTKLDGKYGLPIEEKGFYLSVQKNTENIKTYYVFLHEKGYFVIIRTFYPSTPSNTRNIIANLSITSDGILGSCPTWIESLNGTERANAELLYAVNANSDVSGLQSSSPYLYVSARDIDRKPTRINFYSGSSNYLAGITEQVYRYTVS